MADAAGSVAQTDSGPSTRFMIAYGKRYWPHYQELLGGSEWHDLASGRIRCAIMPHGGRAYLLPFMGQGALRGSDLEILIEDA